MPKNSHLNLGSLVLSGKPGLESLDRADISSATGEAQLGCKDVHLLEVPCHICPHSVSQPRGFEMCWGHWIEPVLLGFAVNFQFLLSQREKHGWVTIYLYLYLHIYISIYLFVSYLGTSVLKKKWKRNCSFSMSNEPRICFTVNATCLLEVLCHRS